MNAFVIASVYQLFNAVNIGLNVEKPEYTDLYVLNLGTGLIDRIDIEYLKEKFNQVYVITPQIYSGLKKALYLFSQILKRSMYDKKISQKYDNVYLTGVETYSKIVACKLLKKTGHMFYYEDGIGSYTVALNDKVKSVNDLPIKIRYGYRPLEKIEAIYVYEPDLIIYNPHRIEILPIPKVQQYSFEKIDILKVFKNVKINLPSKYVFLSSWFEDENLYLLQKKIINVLIEVVGINNCCIKMHPNDRRALDGDLNITIIGADGSFEVSNYFENYEDKVFISCVSTASLTPKWIYNQEPYVILLYKLFGNAFPNWMEGDDEKQRFKLLYKNSDRFFIPDTIDDFKNILMAIKGLSESSES